MTSKKSICNFIKEMIEDEEKGTDEYGELIELMKDYPEQSEKLNKNLGDEISHKSTLINIQEELKCK